MRRAVLVALVASLLVLAGCPRPTVEPPPREAPATPAPRLDGANLYSIDAAASRIHVLVYRGGPMARLGHNHVVTVHGLDGRVWVQPQRLADCGFELEFSMGELIVDDRAARLEAGAEFPPDIPEKDKTGTRTNLLRAEVLDAKQHPIIELRSVRVAGDLPNLEISAAITLKGVTSTVAVPTTVEVDEQHVHARGEFTIKQTDFGITPFSVAFGAVQVQDELRVRFDLRASRESLAPDAAPDTPARAPSR